MLQKTPSLQKNSRNRCKKTGTGWKNTIVWKYTGYSHSCKKSISMNITSSSMIHDQINQGIELCGIDIRQDTGVVWQGDPYFIF